MKKRWRSFWLLVQEVLVPLPLLVSAALSVSRPWAFDALVSKPSPSPPLSAALAPGLWKPGGPPPPLGTTARTGVRVTPPALPEIVTFVEVATALVATVKVALVAPAVTVTLAGTVATAALPLEKRDRNAARWRGTGQGHGAERRASSDDTGGVQGQRGQRRGGRWRAWSDEEPRALRQADVVGKAGDHDAGLGGDGVGGHGEVALSAPSGTVMLEGTLATAKSLVPRDTGTPPARAALASVQPSPSPMTRRRPFPD